jgi:uncharacterized DUF497 family protein
MPFEWDEHKRRGNLAKHRIDFADALAVFSDQRGFIYRSEVSTGEERHVAIGMAGERCLAVVFTKREEVIRLISARRARRTERRRYEEAQR